MTNDIDLKNEEYIEAQVADCEQFLAETDWKNAQAVIDNLYELGLDSTATKLRKQLLNAQYEWVEKRVPPTFDAIAAQMNTINKALYGVEPFKKSEKSELNPNRGDAPY